MTQNLLFLKKNFKKAVFSLSALFALSANINAQIIYTNITDCTTVITANNSQMDLCNVDFDSNGVTEYNFRWDNFGGDWFVHLVPQNFTDNKIALKGTATNPFGGRFVKAFSVDEVIGSTATWGTSMPEPFIGESTTDANFLNLGDKYIGIQFKKNGMLHYGWILVNFSLTGTTRQLIVKSFAYNSVANQQILAGQTTNLGISESDLSKSLKIYPNPVKKSFTIEHGIKSGSVDYEIFDSLGRTVKKETIMNKENQINVSELTKGIYYIRLYNKGSLVGQQKFIKS